MIYGTVSGLSYMITEGLIELYCNTVVKEGCTSWEGKLQRTRYRGLGISESSI